MASIYPNNLEICVASNQLCKSFGIKISPNGQVVQMARNAGFDSLFIDLEHAWLTLAEASNLCNVGHLCGITPFVRVPHQCGNGYIQRVLDGGAMGVIFPHIHNAADAKAAVSISKYPPLGCRSMTGQMPIFGMRGTPVEQTIDLCNKSGSTVFAMIESKGAVERADEIAAVDGVDVVLVDSMDLTIDLGIGGKFDRSEYRSALERISQACRKHGKVFGVAGVYDNPGLQGWIINELAAKFMLVQQDSSLISAGGAKAVKALPSVS
ncbi:HpcH/HpaI aldolase family protein [Aspergillus undulatus]|uniref:HpcH/HpaI aldolase family protein n=1 Tax=Aspergillus undulatus TaxID=1810928 RepID=UPI003CCE0FF6